MPHSSESCFGKRSDQHFIKGGLGGDPGNRADDAKYYNKSEHKWKKELKFLKKKNKILFSTAKKSGSRRELKNTKNIKAKASKKRGCSISNSSRSESVFNSSISSYSD